MHISKLLLLAAVTSLALAACDSNDGMVEKAGQKLDNAATDAGNAIEDTCEDVKKNAGAKDTNC